MSKPDKAKRKARYRVLKRCFVNDTYYDPARHDGPIFVMADEGLDGDALELVAGDAGKPREPPPKNGGNQSGDGQNGQTGQRGSGVVDPT